jgi:xylulose-5-phosphate/fructose-6-phosphate phosphoketolase
MCVLNDLDRYHLVQDVIDRLPQLGARAAYAKQEIRDALIDHKEYIYEHGEDAPEIRGWTWGNKQIASHLDSTEGDNIDAGVEAPLRN